MNQPKMEVSMSQTISQVMTSDPWTVQEGAPIQEAARIMRDADIGDVIVVRPDESVCGIITDRDLVVRAVADGSDPKIATVADVCRHSVVSISSGDPVDQAATLMREHNIRRLPVIDGSRLVGIVSLGDLAIERDPTSALADISKAPPNN
jgi:CBS domain-containing protein